MKSSLFIVFLLVGVTHSLFGPIGQAINNVGNSVNSATNDISNSINSATNQIGSSVQLVENFLTDLRGHVDKVIRELLNSVNQLQPAATFLWDNVFSPAFDMLTQGAQTFLNDKFAAIASILGRPVAVPENALSEKYAQLVARLKSNIHHLYENLFLMQQEALTSLTNGEYNFEGRIRAFYDKIDAIHKQINEWVVETKYELETHAKAIQGDWVNILNQYSQNLDLSVKTIGTMFKQLTENLMKNLLEVVLTVVPNAMNIIQNMKEQGLLSFFHQ